MISLSKLSQITKLNEKTLHFTEDNQFTQKSSIQITIEKLEREYDEYQKNNENNKNTAFMMSQVFDTTNNSSNSLDDSNNFTNNYQIQNESQHYDNGVLLYAENEIINMPDFIESMFKEGISLNGNSGNIDSWYIYGVKNPDSFYKCHVLLNYPDYILKSKREKNSFVSTYKNEIAVQLESTYKKLLYRKFGFTKDDMINTLLNSNQINYPIMIYLSDYNKCNICLIDLTKQSYQIFDNVLEESDCYYIIIRDGNTYIPIMNNNGNHFVNESYLDYVKDRFQLEDIKSPNKERLVSQYKIYKEEAMSQKTKLKNEIRDNANIKEDLKYNNDVEGVNNTIEEQHQVDNNISLQIQINPENSKSTKLIVKHNNKSGKTSSSSNSSSSNSSGSSSKSSKSSKDISSKASKNISSKASKNISSKANSSKANKIKSIKEYTLPDLQGLAKEYGIEIYKMGKREHMVKKLKAELYKELNSAMNS